MTSLTSSCRRPARGRHPAPRSKACPRFTILHLMSFPWQRLAVTMQKRQRSLATRNPGLYSRLSPAAERGKPAPNRASDLQHIVDPVSGIEWRVGDMCEARYSGDGTYYQAKILRLKEKAVCATCISALCLLHTSLALRSIIMSWQTAA